MVGARPTDAALGTLDSTVFRRVIGNFMSGVVVITTTHDGRHHGMTVSAVSSLSMDPPMLLVCLNSSSSTQQAVRDAGRFAVNILAENQTELAERFARSGGVINKFDGLGVRTGVTGVPLLDGALAVIECEVAEAVRGGTHLVFLSRVVHAEATEGTPLAYFRGTFGKLEPAQDAVAYQRLRSLVLSRAVGPDEVLDVAELARSIGTAASSVFYALTRLVGENLVLRDPQRGHVVRPLDAKTSDDAHDATLAIELGVAELTVGRFDAEQLDTYDRLAEVTAARLADGHLTEVGAYISANTDFHRYPVVVSGIDALLDAYDKLSLPEIMARVLTPATDVDPDVVAEHRAIVAAYRAADLTAVKSILVAHAARAKAIQRRAIDRQGGRL